MGNKGIIATALCLAAAGAAATADAAGIPSSRDTRRVVEYYYSDADRPVLMDFQLCRGIHNDGPDRYECLDALSENDLEPGMRVYAWMKFLVPRQAAPTVMLRVEHNDRTRDTWRRQLDSAIRFRTWHVVHLDRSGLWRMEVFHDAGDAPVRLFSRTLRVD